MQSDQCNGCAHYGLSGIFPNKITRESSQEEKDKFNTAMDNHPHVCKAFPAGVPQEIIDGTFDHSQPHPNDGGIRYTPAIE